MTCSINGSLNMLNSKITPAGQSIEDESMRIIDDEAGPHAYTSQEWPVVQRLIHTTADFEMNGLAQFHPQAVRAGIDAMRAGCPIFCDVQMIRAGLSATDFAYFGVTHTQLIDDEEVVAIARAENSTRAVQAVKKAHRLGLIEGGIVAIGNAPTALLEVMRLILDEGVRPALVVGYPVGFVSAAESKDQLAAQNIVPWMVIRGRKGGSTLVVAALRALYLLAK